MTTGTGPQALRESAIGPVWCVIPARLNSKRLPGKLLRADHGEPLIQSTIMNAYRSGVFAAIVVLIDDPEILRSLNRRMPEQITTVCRDGDFRNGTERVASLFANRAGREPGIVVGLQADEPEIRAEDFQALAEAAAAFPSVDCATLAAPLDPVNYENKNVVKVWANQPNGIAWDFGRLASVWPNEPQPLHHVGVYAWRPAALRWYRSLDETERERDLNLEQLRTLKNGGRIRVATIAQAHPGIDDENSYQEFCKRFQGVHNGI